MRARLKRASDRRTLIAPHTRAGGRLLMLLLLLSAAAQSALAMPPGWTKGCIRPIYGSADGACATTLEIPGSFFTVDPVLGSCNYFSSNGAPTSQQSICMACPTGFAIDAQRNCSPQPGFAAADPYANAGSQVQPALSAAGTASDPIFVANPVNANTGNKYQREVDYEGVGPFPLMFVRHYNSQFIYQSQLGLSWRHHYDRQLLIVDATHVVVVRPNGQAFEFVLSGGVWTSAIDIVDRLQNIAGGWRLVTQADETETYDASGRLLSIADHTGLTQTLTYSTALTPPSIATKAGLLIAVTDPLGRQLKLTYDLRFLVKTLTDPAGNVFQYGYNRQTSLTTVISPGTPSATRTYVYQFAGINPVLANTLTSIVDENGQTYASFTYDVTTARTTGSTLGGTLAADPYTIKYNNNGTTSVTDARITRVYSFTILRGIPRVTGIDQPCSACASSFVSRTYDSNGFVATSTDFNGNVTRYQRNDPLGRADLETSRTEASGRPEARTITTEWDAAFRLPHRIAEPLRITTFVYDAQGNLQTRTLQATTDTSGAQGLGAAPTGTPRTWTYSYTYSATVPGLVTALTIDGPRTDVADLTSYVWDSTGNLFSVTNALGQMTTYGAYDANGRPGQIVDANGLVTALTYDARGRIATRDIGGEHTAYSYDGVGQLKTITLPDGSSLTYSYDAAHRLRQIQDNLGNSIAYTLDPLGNRTAEQVFDPAQVLARTHGREYNALNRLTKDIGGSSPATQITQYGYDPQGNTTSVTDPLGHLTSNFYDGLNRLRQVADPAATGAGAGGSTQYSRDGLNQLTQVIDARGLATTYTLDGLGNLTRLASPDTGMVSSAVDDAGNLISQIDTRGVSATFNYDALNRITQAAYAPPAGSTIAPVTITYAYDQGAFGLGHLTGVSDPSGATGYSYDIHGRLVGETRTLGGIAFTTSYLYDPAGRLAHVIYPSGRTVDYTLDALGRIRQIDTSYRSGTQSLVSAVAYQPFGAATTFVYGNAQSGGRTIDLDGRISNILLAGVSRGLSYDPASRITAFRHANPVLDQTFQYDNIDRLTGWSSSSTSQSFSYDADGNRVSQMIGATPYISTYSTTSNRLASAQFPVPFNYQYDGAGNTTQDALRSYGYDARARLTQVVSSDVTSRFTLNAFGQRITKAPDSGLRRVFSYDQAGHLIAESTPAGEPLREYVYLGDLPVALISNDHDDDGVPDARDNCILDANPDQLDTSLSGIGNICNGDANGDGVVNQTDLLQVITLIRRPGTNPLAAKRADMNGDGILNYQDESLLSQWIRQRGVPGPSGLRGQASGPELFYIYADQLGTPRVLVDASNKIRWQWNPSDPFGIEPPDESPQGDFVSLPFNLRYPGQYYDRETGLHYNGARDYDPTTGRYLEPNPVGLRSGVNLYTYAGDNPLSASDPSGLGLVAPQGASSSGAAEAKAPASGWQGIPLPRTLRAIDAPWRR